MDNCRVCFKSLEGENIKCHEECFWKLVADVNNRKPRPAVTAGGEDGSLTTSTLDNTSLPQAAAGI